MFIVVINMEHTELDKLHKEIKKMNEHIDALNKQKETRNDYIERAVIEEEIIRLEQEIELATMKRTELLQLHELQSSCCHVFVEDLIDLTPDTSMTIQYCVNCLFTAKID